MNYTYVSPEPGRYSSVQTILHGCAANTGSKISLLVYEMTPYKMQNSVYEYGLICQNSQT